MRNFKQFVFATAAVAVLFAASLFAQATTTGAVSGSVRTPDGIGVPGVAVTATSPALQGERIVYTGDNGDYIIRGLPPGDYRITFTMEGMGSVTRDVRVDLGGTSRLDIAMSPTATTEAITVTANAPAVLETTQLGTNLNREALQELPLPRGANFLAGIAAMSPGVNTTTPNNAQVRINGAMAFDNVFLVDGTDVNDNLFGAAHQLFIEDAIDEAQVLTGGISAEYGRFTGGVINVITKSGGNEFSGTARADLRNPDWVAVTEFEESRGIVHLDDISEVYSATLGGPLMRDHLWFFLAGRLEETEEQRVLVETSFPHAFGVENPRYEAKLTGTLAQRHTLQASWMSNETTQVNQHGLTGRTMDPRALVTRTLPNERWTAFYNGILSTNLFAEVKYSEKTFGFRGTGGTSTDIHDSPFLTVSQTRHYNAPYFSSLDPEDRNNQDLMGTLSYFLSTRATGSHDLKGGVERYVSNRTGGNSQSSTGYVFLADFKRNGSVPAVDAQARFIPMFVPNVSGLNNWIAVPGANVDITTTSFFVNDHWTPNRYLDFNIGARYEVVEGEATGEIITVDTDRITPRLAASWDVRGDGRYKVDATYSQYSGKYNERQFGVNTNVGNPSQVAMVYTGPAGEGIDFAPGFDLNNYRITNAVFPTINVRVDPDIQSPIVDEWTISGGTQIGRRGYAKLTFTNRQWSDLWEDYIDLTTGTSQITLGPVNRTVNNILYSNNNESWREYQAIQLTSQFRVLNNWNMHANYTHELRNHGNFLGEAGNQPGNASQFGDFPELFSEERHYPEGRMPGYTEHRFRLLNAIDFSLGSLGKIDFGLVYSYDSPQVFNYFIQSRNLTAQQAAIRTQLGYASQPTAQTIYFGDLGAGEFETVQALDLALTYSIPIFRGVEPWVKVDVFNVTNEDSLVQFDTTITADPNGPVDALGLPLNYIPGPNFGRPTSVSTLTAAGHIQLPREFRVAAGIRF